MTKRRRKSVLMWAGFVNDCLDVRIVDTGFGGWGRPTTVMPAIFRTHKNARAEYQDVRRVEIREVSTCEMKEARRT